jgi:hypothetical protein
MLLFQGMKMGHDSSGCDPAGAGAALPVTLPRLPLFRSAADALALVEHHGDLFYLAADQLQVWISDLLTEAMDQFTRNPDPAARSMQTGQAWRAFQRGLGTVDDEDFGQLMQYLARYALHENSVCAQLRVGVIMALREHDLTGEFIGPQDILAPSSSPKAIRLLRRSAQRMCDWLDAMVHSGTHRLWFICPSLFDSDPEKRRRASDLLLDREAATMDEAAAVRPYFHPQTASPRYSPPPQPSIPPAAPLDDERPWPFPILDEALITLWPLVKLHDWTFADLWNVLHRGGVPLAPTPAPDPRRLAKYCLQNLGLRKSTHGQPSPNQNPPPGHAVAESLLSHFHRPRTRLGRGGVGLS